MCLSLLYYRKTQLWTMAANATAAGELERAQYSSKGSPIPTLDPALHRAPSPSSRADHKGQWPSISQLMNPLKNFQKICLAFKTMAACFLKKTASTMIYLWLKIRYYVICVCNPLPDWKKKIRNCLLNILEDKTRIILQCEHNYFSCHIIDFKTFNLT
jgi:hypothetical protein